MPISTTDPRYIAEWTPASISAIGQALRTRYGTGADSFGAKGNTVHYSGYHRSEAWIRNSPDSAQGLNDYSIRGSLNVSQDRNAVSAFDFTPGAWGTTENRRRMKELTQRVLDAARRNDPRLANMYEFAGTVDGVNVITFNAQGGATKSPFDSSHLDHVHASIYRSRQLNNHQGIIDVMLGTSEEVDMTPEQNNALAEVWAAVVAERDGGQVGPVPTHPASPSWLVESIKTLLARPVVPPIAITPAQVADMANLVAAALANNATFLTSVANAVLDEDHRRSES